MSRPYDIAGFLARPGQPRCRRGLHRAGRLAALLREASLDRFAVILLRNPAALRQRGLAASSVGVLLGVGKVLRAGQFAGRRLLARAVCRPFFAAVSGCRLRFLPRLATRACRLPVRCLLIQLSKTHYGANRELPYEKTIR